MYESTRTKREHTGTDWERVRREAAQDAAIPADLTQEPYDPNDSAAKDARPGTKEALEAQEAQEAQHFKRWSMGTFAGIFA